MILSYRDKLALNKDNSRALKYAQHIHYDCSLKELPILADMLEEYGLEDTDCIRHFRLPERCHENSKYGVCDMLYSLIQSFE